MRDSAVFYRSFYEAIKELSPAEQVEVYNAIFEYSFHFNEVQLSGISKTVFTLIKPQIEANMKKYRNAKKANRKQTTSKKEAKEGQSISKPEANVNDNVKENENVNNNVYEKENVNDNTGKELFPFIDFWNLYNKKTEHTICETKWKELGDKDKQLIMERLPAYIAATPEVHFRKNPATYLAYRIWEDEHLPALKPKEPKSAFEMLAETGRYE